MSDHLHSTSLFRSQTVDVHHTRCRPHGPECSGEEFATAHEIVFPRSGVFVKHVRGREVVVDLNQVLFFRRDEPYRVSHPVSGGDDCTVYCFPVEILAAAASIHDPSVRDRPERLLEPTHVPSDPRSVLLHHRLAAAFSAGLGEGNGNGSRESAEHVDRLKVDETAMQLLGAVMDVLYGVRHDTFRAVRPATLRAHRSTTDAARTLLAERLPQPLSLGEISRAVHCSPFHLARVFRREVGMPIHKYLNRLRLREALERLAAGQSDLTGLALDLGCSSHSHFSDAFRREFQVTPSGFRRTLDGESVRGHRKRLAGAK